MDVGLVCDACSALTPIGVPQCTRCGAAVALDPRPRKPPSPSPAPSPRRRHRRCRRPPLPPSRPRSRAAGAARRSRRTSLLPELRARASCIAELRGRDARRAAPVGTPSRCRPTWCSPTPKPGRSTLFFGGAMQAARAKLTLIRGDGEDGVSFTLAGQEHLAGRGDCPISFPDDPFLSPTHANFLYAQQPARRARRGLAQRRLRAHQRHRRSSRARLDGARRRAGAHRRSGAPQPEDLPDAEGTYYSASIAAPGDARDPPEPARRRRSAGCTAPSGERRHDRPRGQRHQLPRRPIHLGSTRRAAARGRRAIGNRSRVAQRHLRARHGERVLKHGDYVFLGQQLLRVEIV